MALALKVRKRSRTTNKKGRKKGTAKGTEKEVDLERRSTILRSEEYNERGGKMASAERDALRGGGKKAPRFDRRQRPGKEGEREFAGEGR